MYMFKQLTTGSSERYQYRALDRSLLLVPLFPSRVRVCLSLPASQTLRLNNPAHSRILGRNLRQAAIRWPSLYPTLRPCGLNIIGKSARERMKEKRATSERAVTLGESRMTPKQSFFPFGRVLQIRICRSRKRSYCLGYDSKLFP